MLLAESDFVSVCCDLNSTSHHLFSDPQFKRMKNTAVIVNAARGPLIDEKALVRALQSGDIAGAGLDVFEDEPLPADSPLRSMNNVMLAPHNANSSPKAWERIHENTLRQLLDGLRA
jgi:D-3-phosphoglycerate dehydrogenase